MNERLITPQEIRHQIWKELGRATQDRHHAWRTPVLSTTGADGFANARTVVLRAVDARAHQLRIYTDARSSKVAELSQQPQATFVFWSPRLGWQLRVRASITLHTSGELVDNLWARVKQTPSASDYLSLVAPGQALESREPSESVLPTSHFAVLNAQVVVMDWLELASTGHRRASLAADTWTWLAP